MMVEKPKNDENDEIEDHSEVQISGAETVKLGFGEGQKVRFF